MKKQPFVLYNTLTDTKEKLPWPNRTGKPLRVFVCGPTVYDTPHIGNARTFVFFDIFVRYLRALGVDILYIQNITDIDDKIINRASEEGVSWKVIARKYEQVYMQNVRALDIKAVDMFARATSYIPEIVAQVQTLIRKKYAYLIEGDGYYFDLSKFKDYGKLSHRTAAQADDGVSRIDDSSKKRNTGDFCLWKLSDPKDKKEPGWKTELGFGRPGWHIEDTAITEHFFGPQYEIHGGAMDLKFPHHEAELAQQEAASGKKPFVKVWMHSGFLTVNGKRMGKSNHNFVTIDDLLARYSPTMFRMAIFMHHYRSPFDYTETIMKTAAKHIHDISLFTEKLLFVAKTSASREELSEKAEQKVTDALLAFNTMKQSFTEAMADDMNTPRALAAVFEYMTKAQKGIWNTPAHDAKNIAAEMRALFGVLGIELGTIKIPSEIKAKVKEREAFKTSKQFMQSDALRNELTAVGYGIEDTPIGPFVYPL